MTREEIDATQLCNKLGLGDWYKALIETFALEMVRKHNEDLQAEFDSQWVKDIIGKAKP